MLSRVSHAFFYWWYSLILITQFANIQQFITIKLYPELQPALHVQVYWLAKGKSANSAG